MSRYNLALTPGRRIPRDLTLGVQMRPAAAALAETIIVAPPKYLSLGNSAPNTGLNGYVGADALVSLTVTPSTLPVEALTIALSSSDTAVLTVPATITIPVSGSASPLTYAINCNAQQGGFATVTATAPGYNSAVILVPMNALAHGANDFAAAQAIIAKATVDYLGYLWPVDNSLFTRETGEPFHSSGYTAGQHSIWWKIKPQSSGLLTVDTLGCADGTDTMIAIYTGSALASLTQVAFNDNAGADSRSQILNFAVTGGVTYYIACCSVFGSTQIRLHYQLNVPSIA